MEKEKLNFTIGRSSNNCFTINNKKVSRNHCRIFVNSEIDFFLEDFSTNGTYVNNRKIRNKTVSLRITDIITIKGVVFIPWRKSIIKLMKN